MRVDELILRARGGEGRGKGKGLHRRTGLCNLPAVLSTESWAFASPDLPQPSSKVRSSRMVLSFFDLQQRFFRQLLDPS